MTSDTRTASLTYLVWVFLILHGQARKGSDLHLPTPSPTIFKLQFYSPATYLWSSYDVIDAMLVSVHLRPGSQTAKNPQQRFARPRLGYKFCLLVVLETPICNKRTRATRRQAKEENKREIWLSYVLGKKTSFLV